MPDEFSQLPPEDDSSRRQEPAEEGVEVPYSQLQPETLRRLIEAFVLREGTDYGEREAGLERKIADVMRQLERGEAGIVFDMTSETCSIIS